MKVKLEITDREISALNQMRKLILNNEKALNVHYSEAVSLINKIYRATDAEMVQYVQREDPLTILEEK